MSRLRIYRLLEDADDDTQVVVPEADDFAVPDEPVAYTLAERHYPDLHPWRCGVCNQPAEPEWHRCPMCGRLREDCE